MSSRRGRKLKALVQTAAVVVSSAVLALTPAKAAHADPQCGTVYIIEVRGTGAAFGGPEVTAFDRAIRTRLYTGYGITSSSAELGNLDGDGGRRDGTPGLDPGEYPASWPPDYPHSVVVGTDELLTHIEDRVQRCPHETIVLMGYSQGADVVGWALQRGLSAEAKRHIGYVALYGDPKFDPGSLWDRLRNKAPWWVRGDDLGYELTPFPYPHYSLFDARINYVSSDYRGRFGSWCAQGDPICGGASVGNAPWLSHFNYASTWISDPTAITEIVMAVAHKVEELNPASFTGAPADGYVIENIDNGGHHYVVAGGRAFWYDRNDGGQEADFIGQMKRLHGTEQPLKMRNDDIHAIEANYPAPAAHRPNNNTFVYERGSGLQYMVQYEYAFPLASPDEIAYLNGVNKAIMVPAGSVAPLRANPSAMPNISSARLLKAISNPDYYEVEVGQLYHADNMTVVDCLSGGYKYAGSSIQSAMQPVSASLIQAFLDAGRNTGKIAHCQLPQNVAFFGPGGQERWRITGDNPYTRSRYTSPFSMRCWLGSNPAEAQISQGGVNQPTEVASSGCPNNTYVRDNQTGQVYQVWDGVLHYIPAPETLSCLTGGHPEVVIGLDEGVFGNTPRGADAQCTFEGRQIQAPNGNVYWVKDGAKHYVGNQQILNCVRVRANAGDPIAVLQGTVDGYPEGTSAYCPYPAEVRFVRGEGQAEVWRVHSDGTREHAQGLCVPNAEDPATDPRYRVYVMPAGEVDGHRYTGEFSPSASACAAIQ